MLPPRNPQCGLVGYARHTSLSETLNPLASKEPRRQKSVVNENHAVRGSA